MVKKNFRKENVGRLRYSVVLLHNDVSFIPHSMLQSLINPCGVTNERKREKKTNTQAVERRTETSFMLKQRNYTQTDVSRITVVTADSSSEGISRFKETCHLAV